MWSAPFGVVYKVMSVPGLQSSQSVPLTPALPSRVHAECELYWPYSGSNWREDLTRLARLKKLQLVAEAFRVATPLGGAHSSGCLSCMELFLLRFRGVSG